MADFKKFYPKLQQNEGGYANDPKDKGGETYAGIARNFWPAWPGWKIIDAQKSKMLGLAYRVFVEQLNRYLKANAVLQDMVFMFFKKQFWNSLQLDFVLSQPLAEQLADFGVNAGEMRPAKIIQSLINDYWHEQQHIAVGELLVPDGDIGPKTVTAINAIPAYWLYAHFITYRKACHNYRANRLDQVPSQLIPFLRDELKFRPDATQAKFLKSWLSRCEPATIPA